MEERVGPLIFTSNFDSGNLAKVERVKADESISTADDVDNSSMVPAPDYEYNVWTAPDCAGTEHENPNRTWFHFGVKGGQSGKLLRINIMNLNRQGKLYNQGMAPMVKVLHGKNKWERIRDRPSFEMVDGQFRLSFTYRFPEQRNGSYFFAFCYPHSYTECQTKLQQLDKKYESCQHMSPSSPSDSIYYKRELLCYSLDGLRVDLLTITSCKGMLAHREKRLPRLFPDASSSRSHKFQGKKVFFLSARVHPGETPSSLVFNGFLDFILRSEDPRAAAARDQYVFKLIPLLNPDGVKRGHYRTDSRGVNLNRVYTDPDPFLHPSIFAAKSVILYHHAKGSLTGNLECTCEKSLICGDESVEGAAVEVRNVLKETDDVSGELNGHCVGAGCLNERMSEATDPGLSECHRASASPDFDSARLELESVMSGLVDDSERSKPDSTSKDVCSNLQALEFKEDVIKSTGIDNRTSNLKPNVLDTNCTNFPAKQTTNTTRTGELQSEVVSRDFSSEVITSKKCLCQPAVEQESGIAYYVDLHGHASKRGCFVYANYLENEEDYVRTILFPKLVSLNSSHFDFAACNFTEKNMYTKDKRDGLSKEGSGRVAVYKATGIVHSYTLECNYNCGRTVNALAAATCDNGRATPPPPPGFPPKYTVEMYEEVGRALVVAALDMKNCNPWTRLPLSEFGSVEGVKNWVKRFVRSAKNAPCVPKKLSRIITRTSSLVAGATGCARQKVGNTLTSYSSSDMSSDNTAGPVFHKSADKLQHTCSLSKEDGKKPPEDLKPPRRVAALINMRRSSHCGQGNSPKTGGSSKSGADQEPPLVNGSTRSQMTSAQVVETSVNNDLSEDYSDLDELLLSTRGFKRLTVYKNKEQSRVSLDLPKTTLQGPVLRMVKHQVLPPAIKSLSRPVEVKVSTVNVQDHLLGFQPKKKWNNNENQNDEEKKKKRPTRLRKRSNGRKENPFEDRKKPAASEQPECDALVLKHEKSSCGDSVSAKPKEEQIKNTCTPKRNSSKNLLGCTVMSCEVVDITELPRASQDAPSPVAYWVDA